MHYQKRTGLKSMKSFIETFPKLKNEEGFSELWQFITVSKVSAKPDMSELKVYIRSERLIEKKRIYDIEKLIKDRLFPYKKIRIRLIEKFNLSKSLCKLYRQHTFGVKKEQDNLLQYANDCKSRDKRKEYFGVKHRKKYALCRGDERLCRAA